MSWRSAHPRGPWVYRVKALRPMRARLIAAVVLAGGLSLFATAAWLEPDPSGVGTHRQLGISECGMMSMTGIPCPTCGMTTAFSLAVRGRWIQSFKAQLAGALLVIAVIFACAVSCSVIYSGKVWLINWFRISPVKLAVGATAILLIAWIVKINQTQ